MMADPIWSVREGDCRASLAAMPERSVQTCVTSPPYFGLRDYGHAGQIGLEPTPEEFVVALVEVFRDVRRVLRDDGTLWLNLGDSFGAGKQLLGMPWRVAFAMQADGWLLRSEIIWHKPNPMPESVTDRPTKAHEQVFLLSKGPRYFYDAEAVREEQTPESLADHLRRKPSDRSNGSAPDRGPGDQGLRQNGVATSGHRNRRSVWTVASQPFAGAHFATFPPKLIEPCILAGAPERACSVCGTPWERQVERTPMVVRPTAKRATWQADDEHARTQTGGTMTQAPTSRTVGFQASCECDAPTRPGVVLDPFSGAGTTGLVALRHGRSYIGCELNPTYAQMARERICDDSPLFNAPLEEAA